MAELDAAELDRRLQELEDPISTIHPAIPELARELYQLLPNHVSTAIDLDPEFRDQYWRPLTLLDRQGFLKLRRTLGAPPGAISQISPMFIGYMAQRAEEPGKMRLLAQSVEECPPGQWLRGNEIAAELALPLPVVQAVFKIYESGGYGILSREIGTSNYLGQA